MISGEPRARGRPDVRRGPESARNVDSDNARHALRAGCYRRNNPPVEFPLETRVTAVDPCGVDPLGVGPGVPECGPDERVPLVGAVLSVRKATELSTRTEDIRMPVSRR